LVVIEIHGSKMSFYRNIVSRVNKALSIENFMPLSLKVINHTETY